VLTPDNFDSHVGGDVPAFVEFYAPWCGHCKQLAPVWEQLATTFLRSPVAIAKVDADEHKSLGSRFDVSGFPTLKFFPAGSATGEAYSGGRALPDLVDFVNKKTGLNVRVKEAPSPVVTLTTENFNRIVKDETKNVLVEFYAPWCGHCKKLAPDYDKVGASFDGESSVVVAKLDADAHKDVAQQYDVSGYPTLKWFPKNNKAGEDYNGGRSPSDFVDFINKQAGTDRTVGGGFTDKAGRIDELDAMVTRFLAGGADERRSILAEAVKFVDNLAATAKNADNAKFYTISMKRMIENPNYATDERARLTKISSTGSITAEKNAQFAKRINIINLFK